jgi:hypothetical protein
MPFKIIVFFNPSPISTLQSQSQNKFKDNMIHFQLDEYFYNVVYALLIVNKEEYKIKF